MRVLLVDPDGTRMAALNQTLVAGGAEVTVATSGSFALTTLERDQHDVVLSRAHISDMDGHELCAILKADPGTRGVRFVLVAGAAEVTSTQTVAAGVDLVLPPAMTGSGIVPLILRLVSANRPPVAPPPTLPALPIPDEPPLEERAGTAPVPRLGPGAVAPSQVEPPRRYVTAAAAAAAAPWSTSTPEPAAAPAAASALPPPDLAPAPPRPPFPPPARLSPTPIRRPLPATPAPARSRPVARQPATPAPTLPVTPPRNTTASVSGPDLAAIPSGSFQGSLEVLELADLTQALATGGKSGRLILALPQGGGLMLFDAGRVVHAEYRNAVGEGAFAALLAASQGEGAGRFCFLPAPAGQSSSMPRTIDKTVDRLLLSSATAIDEKG